MSSQSSSDSESSQESDVVSDESLPQDSPRKPAAPRMSERDNMNLEQERDLYIDEARGYVRQSVVADFYDTYVSDWQRPSEEQVDRIVALLKKRHVRTETEWTSLPATPKKGVLENEHYAGLEPISEAIMKAAEDIGLYKAADRTTKFQCLPNATTSSEVRGGSFRVDGFNILKKTTFPVKMRPARFSRAAHLQVINNDEKEVIYTSDLAMTMEVKLEDNKRTVCEDERQGLGGSGHIMFNDPCRNWHFNLTIEANYARLWIHTRSHSMVTKPFNIQTKPAELIHFFLFLGYATKEQLGYDLTVARVLDKDQELQYRYQVVDLKGQVRWFQTVAILEQKSAARLHSRAMRVFHVREVDAQGNLLTEPPDDNVLRDFWAYEDAQSERAIQEEIFRRLSELPDEDYGDNLRNIRDHFMDFICDMVVGESVPAPPANSTTYQFPDRSNPKGLTSSSARVKSYLRSQAEEIAPAPHEANPKKGKGKKLALHARTHWRTVHRHLCEDVYRIEDPAEFFFVMSQCVAILKRFRRAGFLHRDISPGNFLVHCCFKDRRLPPPDGDLSKKFIVKVADLEYAKGYETVSRHDPLTGTSYYLAVEVQRRKHLFTDKYDYEATSLGSFFFAYNFYHDVESVLWMAIDYVVRRVPSAPIQSATAVSDQPSGQPADDPERQLHKLAASISKYAAKIFTSNVFGTEERQSLITDAASHKRFAQLLKSTHGNESIITQRFPGLMRHLLEMYLLAEKEKVPDGHDELPTLRFDPQAFSDRLYDTLYKAFDEISRHFQQHPQSFLLTKDLLAPKKKKASSKRTRDRDIEHHSDDAPPAQKRSRQTSKR